MTRWWTLSYWRWWWGANKEVLKARLRPNWRAPEFLLTFAAYAIPLMFLGYVLYINYLPFGYHKTFTIEVGAPDDTDSSRAFYLEPSRNLSERKVDAEGKPYRELNGMVVAHFNPGVVLKDAQVTVSVEGGEGIEIIPPYIDFDPSSVEWDYSWDFTQGKEPQALGLVGDAFPFDGCMYFDGKSKLELPDSADQFENGPFTVYAEWKPENKVDNFQQIVGHYNWELLQHSDSVTFQVGRMNSGTGPIYSVEYLITKDFFNQKHTALATYSPSNNGYIELYIDGNLVDRVYFGTDTIYTDYNNEQNVSLGESAHGAAQYLTGCVSSIDILHNKLRKNLVSNIFSRLKIEKNIDILLAGDEILQLKKVILHVK